MIHSEYIYNDNQIARRKGPKIGFSSQSFMQSECLAALGEWLQQLQVFLVSMKRVQGAKHEWCGLVHTVLHSTPFCMGKNTCYCHVLTVVIGCDICWDDYAKQKCWSSTLQLFMPLLSVGVRPQKPFTCNHLMNFPQTHVYDRLIFHLSRVTSIRPVPIPAYNRPT